MPGDKEINDDPPQDTIGGLTWDVLRLQIRDPAFKLNEFFVSKLNYFLISSQESLPQNEKSKLHQLLKLEEEAEK